MAREHKSKVQLRKNVERVLGQAVKLKPFEAASMVQVMVWTVQDVLSWDEILALPNWRKFVRATGPYIMSNKFDRDFKKIFKVRRAK